MYHYTNKQTEYTDSTLNIEHSGGRTDTREERVPAPAKEEQAKNFIMLRVT